jgi:outer membrane immunogenic protein
MADYGMSLAGTASGTDTQVGWVVGAGLEHAFAKNWSAFIEYNYMDFAAHAVTFPVPGFGTYLGDISQTILTIKVGANYRFGG